jgi:ferredoxin-NADP reductase
VPMWMTHLAGQHIDIRLTAPDGYSTQRSYSLASAPAEGQIEITIQRVRDGEVSTYLVDIARIGDEIELRGPIGGYFAWEPTNPAPVLLIGGGSGIVPLMAMIRTRGDLHSRTPFRLIYSVRTPTDAIYVDELRRRVRDDPGLDVAWAYTRQAPEGWPGKVGRVNAAQLVRDGFPGSMDPAVFICGPTGFVESVANTLVDQGHPAENVRTERFGPTGG